jgi:hypothetical protein
VNKRSSTRIEFLEDRTLMSLLGPGGTSQVLGQPEVTLNNGTTTYNAVTKALAASMRAINFSTSASSSQTISKQPSPSGNISIKVDSSGHLISGSSTSTDLVVTGSVKIGNTTYSSPLLTGSIWSFGAGTTKNPVEFDYLFRPTGGSLDPAYFNNFTWIGVDLSVVKGSQPNTFTASFSNVTNNGLLGSVPAPVFSPTISTTPGGSVAIGNGAKLTDSATLSGSNAATGSITFKLYGPDGTSVVDTESAPVNGDGTYSTPNGFVPSAAGKYQWVASYSGDVHNHSVASIFGDEPETVTPPVYPTPLVAKNPLGSLIYDPSASGSIGAAGNTVDYTLKLAANQTLTLVLTPSAGLTGSLRIGDPNNNTIATSTGSAAGATVVIETAPVTTAGTYTLGVSGANSTTGTYTLQAILNAAYVQPTQATSIAMAYDLSGAFASLQTTPFADRAGAVGVLGASPTFFGFHLTTGQSASIAVKGSGGAAGIDLEDGSGNVLALPGAGTGVDGIISNFLAPSTGTYYVKVSGASSMAYDLVVTRGSDFDIHGSSFANAQPLDGTSVVLGSRSAGAKDWYSFNVNAGDNLILASTTPGGTSASGQQFINDFSLRLDLYDPTGTLVATGTKNADGRNEMLFYTALSSGAYRLEVTGEFSTGEYTAAIQGATGGQNAFMVTATNPSAGADLPTQPSSMSVTFSDSVLVSSLSDSDFTIDGVNATGFTVNDSTDVTFNLPALSNGVHNVSIGGVVDIHGTTLTPDNFTFTTDDVAPTVVSSSISEGAILSPGPVTEVVTFSKAIDPSSVDSTDITLGGTGRGVSYTADSFSFDPIDTILTINYLSLPADAYVFRLVSGAGKFTSVAGVPMAGNFEIDFTIPLSTPSISTAQQPASASVGSSIADKATISGGFNPTGTVTFNLYINPNGTGAPLFTDTEALASGSATSAGYTATATGTDYWVARYNGDSNNNAVSSGTAAEPVVITPAGPTSPKPGSFGGIGFWNVLDGTDLAGELLG